MHEAKPTDKGGYQIDKQNIFKIKAGKNLGQIEVSVINRENNSLEAGSVEFGKSYFSCNNVAIKIKTILNSKIDPQQIFSMYIGLHLNSIWWTKC